jgi:hypothetical protein
MSDKNQDRAIRYRRLALAEPDKAKAALLLKIADEAERGVLCTADRHEDRHDTPVNPRINAQRRHSA